MSFQEEQLLPLPVLPTTCSLGEGSRDSSVAIVTGYGLDSPGSIPGSARFFSSPQRLWGPPSLLFNEYRGALSSGLKRPGREADRSPPSSAKVKNGGAIPPLPHTSS
jgi:hypothetical protein